MKFYNSLLVIGLFFIGCGEENGNSVSGDDSSSSLSDNITGIASSKTKFRIAGDYLYTVNGNTITILDVVNASAPISITRNQIRYEIDTISIYNNYIYIGSESNIYIFDKTDPKQLQEIVTFEGVQSCNPITVENGIAYITYNIDSSCGYATSSRLEIIDIRDFKTPKLIKKVAMWAPSGIAIDNNKLFICEGVEGIKIFDINSTVNEDETLSVELNSLQNIADVNCSDVIAHNNNLLISNSSNVIQYDYSSFPMTKLGDIK